LRGSKFRFFTPAELGLEIAEKEQVRLLSENETSAAKQVEAGHSSTERHYASDEDPSLAVE